MPIRTIDHVQLAMPAGNEDEARFFYTEILGLEEVPKPRELATRGGAWFRSGSVAVHLGVDPEFRPAKKAHPAFRCDRVGELLGRLRAHGVAIVSYEQEATDDVRFYVMDPFGNRLEVISEGA